MRACVHARAWVGVRACSRVFVSYCLYVGLYACRHVCTRMYVHLTPVSHPCRSRMLDASMQDDSCFVAPRTTAASCSRAGRSSSFVNSAAAPYIKYAGFCSTKLPGVARHLLTTAAAKLPRTPPCVNPQLQEVLLLDRIPQAQVATYRMVRPFPHLSSLLCVCGRVRW